MFWTVQWQAWIKRNFHFCNDDDDGDDCDDDDDDGDGDDHYDDICRKKVKVCELFMFNFMKLSVTAGMWRRLGL